VVAESFKKKPAEPRPEGADRDHGVVSDEEEPAPAQGLLREAHLEDRGPQPAAVGRRGADGELLRQLGREAALGRPVAPHELARRARPAERLAEVRGREVVDVEELLAQRALLTARPRSLLVLDRDAVALAERLDGLGE